MESYSPDGNGSWTTNVDLTETRVIAGRSRSIALNLQPERAVLYNAFARTYGVPVLEVYQAGGAWTGNEGAVVIEPTGVVVEYLGFVGGRYRHHITFFEPGLNIFPERVYNPNLPTGGRVDIRPGGALEYIITSDELLLFEWPASLNVAETDLERGRTWQGGTSSYNNKVDFGDLDLSLGGGQEASFTTLGTSAVYEGNLCFDLSLSYSSTGAAVLCGGQ